jgi:hypothetical protein
VTLKLVEAAHFRVTCDSCGVATAELCPRRDPPLKARAAAVAKFKSAGWHNDPGSSRSHRAEKEADAGGYGRWYCPGCGRSTHL